MPVLLASASPRRRQLLLAAGVELAGIRAPEIDERPRPGEPPVSYARRMAAEKALAVESELPVLAADTVVHLGGRIFGKPADDEDARAMLTALAGRWHQVTTAWAIRRPGGPLQVRHCRSRVRFRRLRPFEIHAYVQTGEGRDKAGAYAIQGQGAALIERVSGNTTSVIGLPLGPVLRHLEKLGLHPPTVEPA